MFKPATTPAEVGALPDGRYLWNTTLYLEIYTLDGVRHMESMLYPDLSSEYIAKHGGITARLVDPAPLLELLAEASCPNPGCFGQGFTTVLGSGHGCDGTDEVCARTCPVPVPEQEQCQWCDEREAALNQEKNDAK